MTDIDKPNGTYFQDTEWTSSTEDKAIEAFKKYLDLYIGDYDDKDIERFKRLLDE